MLAKATTRKRLQTSAQSVGLSDVARLAAVSTATVSRVLNHSDGVRLAKREAVLHACEELGYVANGAARTLSSKKSKTIGAIVPTVENEAFARMIASVQATLKRLGYSLVLASSGYDPEVELLEAKLFLERRVDGLLLVGRSHNEALCDTLDRLRVPHVHTWSLSDDHACVGVDNIAAGAEVAKYLLDLGHRRLGVITGNVLHNDRAGDRLVGIRQCLAKRKLRVAPECSVERCYGIRDGRDAMRQLLSLSEPPTAVICGNDLLAFGALIEIQAHGLSVPDDMSVTGFNDSDYAAHLSPPLTTVRISSDQIGARAAERLVDAIQGRDTVRVTKLPADLVVRASAGPPRRSTARAARKGHASRVTSEESRK
jgi:LacI family transcriptional regulator